MCVCLWHLKFHIKNRLFQCWLCRGNFLDQKALTLSLSIGLQDGRKETCLLNYAVDYYNLNNYRTRVMVRLSHYVNQQEASKHSSWSAIMWYASAVSDLQRNRVFRSHKKLIFSKYNYDIEPFFFLPWLERLWLCH